VVAVGTEVMALAAMIGEMSEIFHFRYKEGDQ